MKRSNAPCASDYIARNPNAFCVHTEKRDFIVFDSYADYVKWVKTIPDSERNFHEFIKESDGQKLKFDIDAPASAVNTYKPNTTVKPNISDKLAKDLASSNGKFQDICYRIAETIIDLFVLLYEYEPEFVVCESKDTHKPAKQYSRHLIIDGFYVSGSAQAEEFTKRLKRVLPEEVLRFLDTGVNKRLQAFRLPGSVKKGEARVKRVISATHCDDDAVITNVAGLTLLPDITVQTAQPVRINCAYNDDIDEIFTAAGLDKHHRFRMRLGAMYVYNRTAPSYCEFCKRVHDHDNTLILRATPPTDEGVVDVYMSCRKYNLENEPRSRRIGGYITTSDADTPGDTAKRCAKLERIIKKGVLRLGETLFAGCKGITYSEPTLRNFELCDTLVVHAAMKMGKTKKLREYIAQNFPPDAIVPPIIRFVSFRQTFAGNIKENFPDFVLYSDVKEGLLTHPRLIIQVESLHRLEVTSDPPDLLILDESESIFEQFESGLIRQFPQSCAKFIYMLKYAKHVICMDANITSRTESILRKIREKPIYYHYNSWRNAQDYTYKITSSYSVWGAMLDKYIRKGKRVAIPASSLNMASAIADVIRRRHPDIQLMLYSSETEQSVKAEHFANVNEWWAKYDVIVYTPTVTAGVSFEMAHFDRIFGYFTDTSCNDLSCIQMLGRIRDVKSRKIVLCIVATGGDFPVEPEEIVSLYYDRRSCLFTRRETPEQNGITAEYNVSGELVLVKSPYFHIWVANVRARNLSKNDFASRLISMIACTGASIEYVKPTEDMHEAILNMREEIIEASNRNKTEKQTAIANAEDVDDAVIQAIYDKLESGAEVAASDINIIRKYSLRTHYKYHDRITPAWVKTYATDQMREIYRNLCMVGLADERTLRRIQCTEAATYLANMQLGDDQNFRDMKRKYMYVRHSLAADLVKLCGFTNIYDQQCIHQAAVELDTQRATQVMSRACREFHIADVGRLVSRDAIFRCLLTVTNTVLRKMYGFTIKQEGPMAVIRRPPKFVYPHETASSANATAPCVVPIFGDDTIEFIDDNYDILADDNDDSDSIIYVEDFDEEP